MTGIIQKYGSHCQIPEMYTHCSMTCFVIYSMTSNLFGFSTVFALSSQFWWCSQLLSHVCITGMQSLEKSKILGKKKHNDKSLNNLRSCVSREKLISSNFKFLSFLLTMTFEYYVLLIIYLNSPLLWNRTTWILLDSHSFL